MSKINIRNKRRQFQFDTRSYGFWFLPTTQTVFNYLGAPSSFGKMIRFLESELGIDSGLSNQNISDMKTKGVGPKVFNKVFAFLKAAGSSEVFSLSFFRNAYMSVRYRSNKFAWLQLIEGSKRVSEPREFKAIFEFIERRGELEIEFMKCLKAIPSSDLGSVSVEHIEWYKDVLQETNVPDEQADYLIYLLQAKDTSELEGEAAIKCIFHQEMDFYFSLLAAYEAGVLLWCKENGFDMNRKSIQWFEKGLFSKVLPLIEDANEDKSSIHMPFDRLLMLWKEWFTELGVHGEKPMSLKQMAQFIPLDNEQEYTSTTTSDKKYNKLKAWRNSSEIPSDRVLCKFISALKNRRLSRESSWMFEMGKLSLMMDRLIKDQLNQAMKSGLNVQQAVSVVCEVYSDYPRYQAIWREKHNLAMPEAA